VRRWILEFIRHYFLDGFVLVGIHDVDFHAA
jgi:hypothetical protein